MIGTTSFPKDLIDGVSVSRQAANRETRPSYEKALWEEFGEIQRAAGINLECHEDHECTPACNVYGFHDLRRGFATQNAARLSPVELQARMRHVSFQTTQEYINLANQLTAITDRQFVPTLKAKSKA